MKEYPPAMAGLLIKSLHRILSYHLRSQHIPVFILVHLVSPSSLLHAFQLLRPQVEDEVEAALIHSGSACGKCCSETQPVEYGRKAKWRRQIKCQHHLYSSDAG